MYFRKRNFSGLKSPEIRNFSANAAISLASSLHLPPASVLHLLHHSLKKSSNVRERGGEGSCLPSLYLELPQVYCSVSGDIELGKNPANFPLVHLIVANGIQIFDHLLDVDEAAVVAVNGIEQLLIMDEDKDFYILR